jgi:hypothetical protein
VKTDWDARPLADEPIVRLILDGTVVRVRLDRKATSISLLVVIGVREDGQKMLLAIKSMQNLIGVDQFLCFEIASRPEPLVDWSEILVALREQSLEAFDHEICLLKIVGMTRSRSNACDWAKDLRAQICSRPQKI